MPVTPNSMIDLSTGVYLCGGAALIFLLALGLIFFFKTGNTQTSNQINYDADYFHNDR